LQPHDFRALAEWRYQIRRFLAFSEEAARSVGLEPQQHQLLLAVKGLPADLSPTIGVLAERLSLRHHTVVELVDRMVERLMLRRCRSAYDRRAVLVALRPKADRLLRRLSVMHQRQLRTAGPKLIEALQEVLRRAERL
jgi:DNA-binding MarR family transcriptional regulator